MSPPRRPLVSERMSASAAGKWVNAGSDIALSEGGARITCTGYGTAVADSCAMIAGTCGVGTSIELRVVEYGEDGFCMFLSPRPLDATASPDATDVYTLGSDGVTCWVQGQRRRFGPAGKMVSGSLVAMSLSPEGWAVSVDGAPKAVVCADVPTCDMYAIAYLRKGASISVVAGASSGGACAHRVCSCAL